MSSTTQVAFTLSDDDLARVDELVPDPFPSRAAALRAAVHDWLESDRRQKIDAALERGYADVPEDHLTTTALAASSTRALADTDLDW